MVYTTALYKPVMAPFYSKYDECGGGHEGSQSCDCNAYQILMQATMDVIAKEENEE